MKQQRPPELQEPISLLSVVIPARDEEGRVGATVEHLYVELRLHLIEHEIVVVDDGSTDGTWEALKQAMLRVPTLRPVQNNGEHGFGRAVSYGLGRARGDAIVVMMADESDDCRDVVRYCEVLNEGWDAVFGSRFIRGGGVVDYPQHKLLLNRLANLFPLEPDDHRDPLKTIVRGYTWTVIPITWRNRRSGVSKLKIRERYPFIALYCWLEKHFSRGDYVRKLPNPDQPGWNESAEPRLGARERVP